MTDFTLKTDADGVATITWDVKVMDGLMASHAILRKIERAGMDPKTNKGGKPIAAAHGCHGRLAAAARR